jgi:2-polyprenyl-3-methyl-5-hydroxy-6-metoxy-1,4-benzoquinol methylase
MKQAYDPIGLAVSNYYHYQDNSPIVVRSPMIEDELLPPEYFFREYSEMPLLERTALKKCKGSVLDVGACAGCHSLYLQEKGFDVTAMDVSALCCNVMQSRGVKKVLNRDIFDFDGTTIDTIILLMNGIGIAGNPDKLTVFLKKLKSLLNPGGQIIIDSSDLIYLYEQSDGTVLLNLNSAQYYGVIDYQLFYNNKEAQAFQWLFADQGLLSDTAELAGLKTRILEYGPHYDYLAELTSV